MEVKLLQLPKAESPIEVTLLGIVMLVKFLQKQKAESPIQQQKSMRKEKVINSLS